MSDDESLMSPNEKQQISRDDEDGLEGPVDPGTLPDEVYERTMSSWRFAARRFIMRNLREESDYLAKMQRSIRTPWLDTYFVYTSSLGTHTFFMTSLPMFFFFGFQEMGRGYASIFMFFMLDGLMIFPA